MTNNPVVDTTTSPEALVRDLVCRAQQRPSTLACVMGDLLTLEERPRAMVAHRVQPDLGPIRQVCLSSDGAFIAVVTGRLAVCWDMKSKAQVLCYEHPGQALHSICFSHDARLLACAGNDGNVVLVERDSGQPIQTFQHPCHVNSVYLTADGRLVTGAADTFCRIFDTSTGCREQCLPFPAPIAIVWACDRGRWLTIEGGGMAELWNLDRGMLEKRYEDKGQPPALFMTTRSQQLLSSQSWHSGLVWQASTGKLLRRFNHQEHVRTVVISMNGRRLVTTSDNTARYFDVDSGRLLGQFGHPDWVHGAVIHPTDQNRIVSCSEDQTARLWDVQTGECVHSFTGFSCGVIDLLPAPDGGSLWVSGYDNTAKRYDLGTGRITAVCRGHGNWVGSLDCRGKLLATGSHDASAKIWDEGKLLRSIDDHDGVIYSLAFSADGSSLATGGRDPFARLFDVRDGRLLQRYGPHPAYIRSLALSPDGCTLFTGDQEGCVRQWALDSGELLRMLPRRRQAIVYDLAISQDGRYLAAAFADRAAAVFEVKTERRCRLYLGHRDAVRSVLFTPDGLGLLTTSLDCTARLYELSSGRLLMEYTGGHTDWVRTAVMLDGRVITGSKDNSLCIWEASSGRLLGRMHYLREGFLWTTPPCEEARSGWFWTDRPELVEVEVDSRGDDGGRELLAAADPRRAEHIAAYNSHAQVMSRLGFKGAASSESLAQLTRMRQEVENLEGQVRLLPCGSGE